MCGSPSPHHPMAESRPQPEIAAAASSAGEAWPRAVTHVFENESLSISNTHRPLPPPSAKACRLASCPERQKRIVRFCSPISGALPRRQDIARARGEPVRQIAEREGVSPSTVLRTSKRNSFVSTVPSPSPAAERDAKLRAVAAHRASESDVPLRGPRKPVERPQALAATHLPARR